MLSIIVLTYNSAASIRRTLASLLDLSADIYVVDSFSTDQTVSICEEFGCVVTQRAFVNYADQRNWAIDNFSGSSQWQLHVDADEEIDPVLRHAIASVDWENSSHDGYMVCRRIVFMGLPLRFSGIARTWHMRLFRVGHGRCEDRMYDQHFVCDGSIGELPGAMFDHQEDSLSEWTARHNRWSDLESQEAERGGQATGKIVPRFAGNRIERRRFQKSTYYRMPILLRPILFFCFRYFFQLGFLDGRRGLIYHLLQALWFRFLVDAKIFESSVRQSGKREPG